MCSVTSVRQAGTVRGLYPKYRGPEVCPSRYMTGIIISLMCSVTSVRQVGTTLMCAFQLLKRRYYVFLDLSEINGVCMRGCFPNIGFIFLLSDI